MEICFKKDINKGRGNLFYLCGTLVELCGIAFYLCGTLVELCGIAFYLCRTLVELCGTFVKVRETRTIHRIIRDFISEMFYHIGRERIDKEQIVILKC